MSEAAIDTPTTQPQAAEVSPETKALNAAIDAEPGANTEPSDEAKADDAKPEPTAEQRENKRLQRRVERLLQQRGELRARLQPAQQVALADDEEPATNAPASDNETLQLSRAQLQKLVEDQARKLAPQLKQQEEGIERRTAIVGRLAKTWGQEKFDAYAADLDEAFGGLADDKGRPKPATDAIFEAEEPQAIIEYLADPEHAEEAESIGRMSAVQAGRAIAKLETKLATIKAEAKPQPSKAPAPLEPIRGEGKSAISLAGLSDAEFAKRRREQIANRR